MTPAAASPEPGEPTSPPAPGGEGAGPDKSAALPRLRFSWIELSGAFGDLGTFLPLSVGLAAVCGLDLGAVLVLAGAASIATGLWSGQPIPIQPMKAIAALAIAERWMPAEIAAAGMAMGVAMVAIAASGLAARLAAAVPHVLVRGVQLGVGVKLALAGAGSLVALEWSGMVPSPVAALPWLAPDGLLVAFGVAVVLALPVAERVPLLLVVVLAGFALEVAASPQAFAHLSFEPPRIAWVWPDAAAWTTGVVRGAAAQLPLTLLNSVVAVCALSADVFPGRAIRPGPTAWSIGLVNLVTVPLGGMPLCHGAGGLAAQVRFGARTGGSMVMLGAIKLAAGLTFGAAATALLVAYPTSVLAVLLVFAGLRLAAAAGDVRSPAGRLVLAAMAVAIVTVHAAAGFVVGVALLAGARAWRAVRGAR